MLQGGGSSSRRRENNATSVYSLSLGGPLIGPLSFFRRNVFNMERVKGLKEQQDIVRADDASRYNKQRGRDWLRAEETAKARYALYSLRLLAP